MPTEICFSDSSSVITESMKIFQQSINSQYKHCHIENVRMKLREYFIYTRRTYQYISIYYII